LSWFFLADSPETAFYLSAEERVLTIKRRNREIGQTQAAQAFHWKDVRLAIRDWKVWMFCFAQFGSDTMLYGFSTFLPTIIEGIHPKWSPAVVQLLTMPCYALGAITYLLVARISDHHQRRGIPTVLLGIVSVIGYAMLMSDSSSGVHYAGCFLVAMGLYVVCGIPLAWLPSNSPRYGKRTTASGLQLTIGNMSGIMAPFVGFALVAFLNITNLRQLYPTNQGPRYIKGHAVTLALVGFAVVVLGSMSVFFGKINRRRSKGEEDARVAGLSDEEINELGDRSPRFVYTI
jgi:hypothetical protein